MALPWSPQPPWTRIRVSDLAAGDRLRWHGRVYTVRERGWFLLDGVTGVGVVTAEGRLTSVRVPTGSWVWRG
jgi:hypothetical protein